MKLRTKFVVIAPWHWWQAQQIISREVQIVAHVQTIVTNAAPIGHQNAHIITEQLKWSKIPSWQGYFDFTEGQEIEINGLFYRI